MTVVAAVHHAGPARRLVHRLKYDGVVAVAEVLGALMETQLPSAASALVPLPRAGLRRWRYGVDPALALALVLARRSGLPLVHGMKSAVWWPRHAGRGRADRGKPRFRLNDEPGPGWVFIDDVLTSGGTMRAAAAATKGVVRLGVTATGVGTLESTAQKPSDSPGRLRGGSAANQSTAPR